MLSQHEANLLACIAQEELTMRKMTLMLLGSLLLAGSVMQAASASDLRARQAYHAPRSTTQQLRDANNSTENYARHVGSHNHDFDRSNTFD